MHASSLTRRHAVKRVVLALACALVVCLGAAAAAQAAPLEPTLTVAQLQALLDASPGGTVDGYFKTVLKGSDIVDIPVTVQSTVPYSIPEGSLILFQASGEAIERIGGIAHGMSGSPLYVSTPSGEHLVGAVSYGDVFTRGYLGLATPVEYMAAMEDTFLPAPAPVALAQPVAVGGRSVSRVVVARSGREARTIGRRAGTAIMAPLAVIGISGLPPKSIAYKHLVAYFEERGCDVAPYGTQLAGSAPSVVSPLVGGASVGVLLARGDVLYGAAGTVTWTDGDRVVMFGHPFWGQGAVQFYMTSGVVDGVWSSNYDPYKLITPGSVQGTVLQDRGSGVAGRIGDVPLETPVTGEVQLEPQSVTGRTQSFVPRGLMRGDTALLAADLLAAAGYDASDNASAPGSALTETTIVVSDGVAPPYTVVRSDTWDDSYDVLGYLSGDAAIMLGMLVADPDGTAPASILSVDMKAVVSPARSSARIAAARFPSGLKAGTANKVEVTLYVYGRQTPLTVTGELVLPPGVSTSGALSVYPAATGPAPVEGGQIDRAERLSLGSADDRQTVAQRVAAVETLPTNDQLLVAFAPDAGTSGEPVKTTLTADGTYVTGSIQQRTGELRLRVAPASVPFKGSFVVNGTLAATAGATPVDLYRRDAGTQAKVKIATVTAQPDGRGGATFSHRVAGWTGNAQVIAEWSGDSVATGATARAAVVVRQSVALHATKTSVPVGSAVKLTASVLPGKPGQAVLFERKTGSGWILVGSVRLGAGHTSNLVWRPPLGSSTLRARVPATPTNGAAGSPSLTLTATVH